MKRHLQHLRLFDAPALLSLACILAGCAGTPAPVTQRVEVPVPVSCVKAADVPKRPDYRVEKLAPGASDGEKVLAFVGDWAAGRKYEGKLEAALAGCR